MEPINDQLHINQHIRVKTNRKNLAMLWIDYRKVYEKIPQPWILECLKTFKILRDMVINQEKYEKSPHKNWRTTEAFSGNNSLFPPQFVMGMIPFKKGKCDNPHYAYGCWQTFCQKTKKKTSWKDEFQKNLQPRQKNWILNREMHIGKKK